MANMFDVIGGLLIFAVVVMLVLQLNIFTMEKNTQSVLQNATLEAINGTELTTGLGGLIEADLAKIGVGDSVPPAILVADSNRITFRGDVTGDGIADSVKYYITVPPSVPDGTNPNLKYLYRRQNTESGTKGWWGVSSFTLEYLDNRGRPIATPVPPASLPNIRSIRVKLLLESRILLATGVDTSFAATYWETLVSPPNIQ